MAALTVMALACPALAAPDLTSMADQVLTLANQQQAARGLQPLARVGALDRCAQDYAARMASEGFFSHTAPDGSDPGDRIETVDYPARTWGENIASGQQTAEAVMASWMNSPGHAANIQNGNFTHIGIGVAVGGPYRIYWVQNFGVTFGAPPAGIAPHLDRLSTAAAARTTVTLEGTNLGSPGGVTISGTPAVVEQWTTTAVVVRAPTSAGTVVLTNAQGSSNGLLFGTAGSPPPPPTPGSPAEFTLRGLSPRFGVIGAKLRLSGSGFGSATGRVTVDGVNAAVVSWSDTLIMVRTTGTTRGRHDVRAVRADGQSSNAREFRQTR